MYKEFHTLYITSNYRIKEGLDITGGIHYINTKLSNTVPSLSNPNQKIELYNLNLAGLVGIIEINKWYGITKNTLSCSFSNYNLSATNSLKKVQFQPEYAISLYPLNTGKFYSETRFKTIIEKDFSDIKVSPVLQQSLGLSFAKYFFTQISASFGEMKNFTENTGSIANNDRDKIKQRYSVLLNVALLKYKLNVYFMYQYKIKENEYILNNNKFTTGYTNQSFIGGIKWYL